jgi:hypothetical protein
MSSLLRLPSSGFINFYEFSLHCLDEFRMKAERLEDLARLHVVSCSFAVSRRVTKPALAPLLPCSYGRHILYAILTLILTAGGTNF